MGLNFLGSRSYCGCDTTPQERVVYVDVPATNRQGNPDPQNFTFSRLEQVGNHVVVEVVYPDCKNYEGKKILILPETTVQEVVALSSLDPHFCDGEHISPFARFEPTDEGWNMAMVCAGLLSAL